MELLAADPNQYAGWAVVGTLVATLLTFVITLRKDGKAGETAAAAPYKAGLEAAQAEIEQLRAENAGLHRDRETAAGSLATLRAENRHLRAALRRSGEADHDQ